MGLFDFKTQRMHTQLHGNTTGREMFQVEEYNKRKQITASIILGLVAIFTLLYFCWSMIPTKVTVFIILGAIGLGAWLYFNLKAQKELKDRLY